jgi:SAM-dependent methyltransferase
VGEEARSRLALPSLGAPLSPAGSTAAIALEALRILGRVVRHGRVRRDRGRVAAEYDGGYWADVLSRKPWRQAASLADFLIPEDRSVRIAKVDGRFTRISTSDYYRYRFGVLERVLLEYAGSAPRLAELGCGYGANLFDLVALNRWRPLIGLDVSAAALQAGREIARHFGREDDVEFHQLDLVDRSAPSFGLLKGASVFSYYCFEQLKPVTGEVVDNLLRAGVSRVIHIEATPELWRLWNPADAVSRLYTWSQDYQDNLLTTLRDRERRGALKLVTVRRLHYAPSVRHDPTLVCWEPLCR